MTENRTAGRSTLWKRWKRFTQVFSIHKGGAEMTENRKRILDMLAEGKINVDEAERLLAAAEQPAGGEAGASDIVQGGKPKPKYLRVVIGPSTEEGPESKAERVNVRVPLSIIRAGIKLKALIPPEAATKVNEAMKSKGINLDLRHVKDEDIEGLIDSLSELEVDIQDGRQKVRVFVE